MDPSTSKLIVLTIVFLSSFLTWKMVKDFYKTKFNIVVTHIIAVMSASFMLLSTMFLFMPKNYQRGVTPEVDLNISSIITITVMLLVLYLFFRYIPQSKTKK